VVLLSDGAAGVPVYTVALGTDEGVIEQGGQTIRVAPDPEALAQVAQASGGRSFAAEDSGALDEVYERLGSQIGTRKEQREITAFFAAAGLLLLGAGVATSLRWRGRFP
jgi:Ca-activated chloride channel family protein